MEAARAGFGVHRRALIAHLQVRGTMADGAESLWQMVDHAECEAAPIHTPDAIQAQGWLIAFDLADGRVTHVSENLIEPATQVVESTVLGRNSVTSHRHSNFPALPSDSRQSTVGVLKCPGSLTIPSWSMPTQQAIITSSNSSATFRPSPDSTSMIATLLSAANWQAFAEAAVAALGRAFGYSRTMAYTIYTDGHGEVTAEYLNDPGLQPYLGLHYPATDIPAQARRLYVLQLVRVIEDVGGDTVRLLGTDSDDERAPKLDLSFARHRASTGAPAVHAQHGIGCLGRGVGGVWGRLAGMFVMHHNAPRSLGRHDRAALVTQSSCLIRGGDDG